MGLLGLRHVEDKREIKMIPADARTIPGEILVKIMNDPQSKEDFLEICHRYDSNSYVCGMGKDNLFVKGDIA